ncbi:MAG: M1 family aminopeptidase [Steroidobacteraceae bacterium]
MRFLAPLLLFLPSASFASDVNRSHYRLDIVIDAAADIARISGDWRLPPRQDTVRAIEFLLSPFASDPVLQASCGGAELPIAGVQQTDVGRDRRWSILFRAACLPKNPLTLSFQYEYSGTAAPQLRIAHGEGFAGSGGELWYPQESFAELETAVITIDTPAGVESVATGDFLDERPEGERVRSRFESRTPGKLAFAYGQYRIVVRGGSTVMQLARSMDADANAIAGAAAKSVAVLADAFGLLPYRDLRIVEVDFQSQLPGANELGLRFVDSAQMREAETRLAYWAHELAHQWWGVSVRPFASSPGAAMLTEGMAQYGALLVLERVEGAESAAEYRRNGRDDDMSQSLTGYRALVADGGDQPIAGFVPQDQAEVLLAQRIATSKGAIAINEFAERFGRAEFHAALRAFLERHRGGKASWTELEAELVRVFGPEAEKYLKTWFHQPGWGR